MQIAMISAHSSPIATLGAKEAGGMNVYVRALSRELGRRGVSVDIFTRSQDPHVPTITPIELGVRVVSLRAGPTAPYDKNLLLDHMPEFVDGIQRFAASQPQPYDLVHSHYWLSGVAGLKLRRNWHIPLVHMFHTLGALKNRVARSDDERETERRIEIERWIAREADMLIAATPQDRADLVWHAGAELSKIETIACGVDPVRFKPRDSATARAMLGLPAAPQQLVLLVGRIEPLKGIDALIEAIALLHQRRPDWRDSLAAVIVGGDTDNQPERWNAEQRRLHELRVQLGVESSIHFVGAQPQDRLPFYYAAADVVTMPSHYESFGMAALEGLACGRPVVATSAGGPAFILEDGVSGLLTPPDDAAALANRLEGLLEDDALRQRMGNAARERAAQFAWPNIACDVMDVYHMLLAAHQPFVARVG